MDFSRTKLTPGSGGRGGLSIRWIFPGWRLFPRDRTHTLVDFTWVGLDPGGGLINFAWMELDPGARLIL